MTDFGASFKDFKSKFFVLIAQMFWYKHLQFTFKEQLKWYELKLFWNRTLLFTSSSTPNNLI